MGKPKIEKIERKNPIERFIDEVTGIADDFSEKIQHASNIVKGQKVVFGEAKKFRKNLLKRRKK